VNPISGAWLYQSYGQAAPFRANGHILALRAVTLLAFLTVPVTRRESA